MAMDNITSNNNANFYWWFGVVEDRNDPLRLGRCRVRIIGYHTEDNVTLPTEDLPWAMPVMPANSAGTSGVGWSPTGAVEGSWVVGFFADGENGQHPMFFGTVGAIPGGLNSNDCSPTEGSGSTEDAATSSGSSDSAGDASSVSPPVDNKGLESFLEQYLDKNGSRIPNYGPLAKAAIMAQCYVETGRFTTMVELGDENYFINGISRGKDIHKGYDIRGRRPTTAKQMGNTNPGDGAKYKGRGYIQLTWKNNYRDIGNQMGRDFVSNPDQVATKEVAAEIVVQWFSNPKMKGAKDGIAKNNKWGDPAAVTKAINGGKMHLKDRTNAFAFYRKKYKV